ncbi:MAG: hypothetical protein GXP45_00735 [bacterium]|nr:hypothetical protein [bacterium]
MVSNILIVLPLVVMETLIGQESQSCGPKAFAKIKKGTSRIQRLPIIASIFIFMYYSPIMARAEVFLVKAFSGAFLLHPTNYFNQEILGLTSNIQTTGHLQISIVISLVISFIVIAIVMRKGIKSVSKVLKYTVPIPFIILLILAINNLSLT